MSKIRIKELSNSLVSKDKEVVLKAIKSIREEGKDELLIDLAKAYLSSANKEVKDNIYALFCDLRNQSSVASVINILNDDYFCDLKTMLVSACWQTRLNFSEHLELFIEMVVKEEFELSFEAFTVVENMESKITTERKKALIAFTNKLLDQTEEISNDLAKDIVPIIMRYDEVD